MEGGGVFFRWGASFLSGGGGGGGSWGALVLMGGFENNRTMGGGTGNSASITPSFENTPPPSPHFGFPRKKSKNLAPPITEKNYEAQYM